MRTLLPTSSPSRERFAVQPQRVRRRIPCGRSGSTSSVGSGVAASGSRLPGSTCLRKMTGKASARLHAKHPGHELRRHLNPALGRQQRNCQRVPGSPSKKLGDVIGGSVKEAVGDSGVDGQQHGRLERQQPGGVQGPAEVPERAGPVGGPHFVGDVLRGDRPRTDQIVGSTGVWLGFLRDE